MSSKPWIAWYPADYRSKTAHLTFEQSEAYRRLLEAYYDRRGKLENDRPGLYRTCAAMTESERSAVDFAVDSFFSIENGYLVNGRASFEIAKQADIHARLSNAGRRGGRLAGKGRPIKILGLAQANSQPQPQEASGISNASDTSTLTKKHTKARSAPFVLPDWVPEDQWNAWLEARTKRRNPPTEWAKKLAVRRLEDLKDQGHSPALVLAESAFNGWAGLFEPKGKK